MGLLFNGEKSRLRKRRLSIRELLVQPLFG